VSRVQRPAYQICAACGVVAVPKSTGLWWPPKAKISIPYYLCGSCAPKREDKSAAYDMFKNVEARMLRQWRIDHEGDEP
jgi:hypothetical protein